MGKQVRCSGCGNTISVPATKSEESAKPTRGAKARKAPKNSPDTDEETRLDLGEKRETQEAHMDMTPMVDVTFQLLIFFMVTA
ncbi:MAG: hypothetical protein EA424_00505, partial [Planctomycetaceae bacterium]